MRAPVVAVVALVLCVAPARAAAPLRLSTAKAKADANIALGRRFGNSWSGLLTIWLTSTAAGGYVWNYSYAIRRLDEYCASVAPKVHCVKTFRVTHGREYE